MALCRFLSTFKLVYSCAFGIVFAWLYADFCPQFDDEDLHSMLWFLLPLTMSKPGFRIGEIFFICFSVLVLLNEMGWNWL